MRFHHPAAFGPSLQGKGLQAKRVEKEIWGKNKRNSPTGTNHGKRITPKDLMQGDS